MKTTKPVSVSDIPPDLWRLVKMKAAADGVRIADVVAQALKLYVDAA